MGTSADLGLNCVCSHHNKYEKEMLTCFLTSEQTLDVLVEFLSLEQSFRLRCYRFPCTALVKEYIFKKK